MRFLLLLPLALAAQTPAPAPKPGAIEGVVVNSATGGPIGDCTVIFQSASRTRDRFRYIAVTDERGRFSIPKAEPDPGYRAEAQCAGFTMPAETRQNRKELEPVSVAEEQTVRDVRIKLVPLGAISGKVTDADGEPLRGVSVQALQYRFGPTGKRLDVMANATTDGRGRYRLYFLQPGRYIVRSFLRVTPPGAPGAPGHVHNSIAAEGFLPAWFPGPPDSAQGGGTNIQPATDLDGLDFRLPRTPVFGIRGRLVSSSAEPPAVVVAPCSTPGLDRNFAFKADPLPEQGFQAASVPPGQYCLAASQSSWRSVSADAVVVVADRDVEGIVLQAPARSPLEGSVTLEDPTATLPRLNVMLQDPAAPGCCDAFAEVQSDGSFSSRPVAPGTYLFQFGALPKGLYIKALRTGQQALPGNRIDVRPGTARLSVVLGTDAGEIQGTVRDNEGKPGDHMTVTLVPQGELAGRLDLMRTVDTALDGSFQIASVAPGEYQVLAWENASEDLRSPDFQKLFNGKGASVNVTASAKASVQVTAIPAQEIEDAKWRSQ